MNLRDLQYLVAVADHKHFGKAADACFVSQPTLSAQIKKLEDYLGVILIERLPRKVQLTPIGKDIVERARIILRDVQQIQEVTKQARDPEAGEVRLGLIPTLAPYLLPLILPIIRQHFPKLKLYLYEDQTARLLRQLQLGKIDAVILALPIKDANLVCQHLFDEPFNVAFPAQHRLRKKHKVSIEELDQETLLLLEDGHCLRDQALEVCSRVGVHKNTNFAATSLETLRQMVAAGRGLTLLPQLAVTNALPMNEDLIGIRPFRKPAPFRKIGMLWRETSAQTERLQHLADVVREEFVLPELPR